MKIKKSTLVFSTIVVFLALSIPVFSNATTIADFVASLFRLTAVGNPQTTISKYGICRVVGSNNPSVKDIFVPLGSEAEWSTFVDNVPVSIPSVTLGECSTNCAKIPISILLTSNGYDATTEHYPGADFSGAGGQGSTTLNFNWSTGSVMQPVPTSALNYDPESTYGIDEASYGAAPEEVQVVPFNIGAVITFSDGTTETLDNIAPPDGKYHQLPGDWSLISATNPVNTCAQSYEVPIEDDESYGAGDFPAVWQSLNFPGPGYSYNGSSPQLERFNSVSNCTNFSGMPASLYNSAYNAAIGGSGGSAFNYVNTGDGTYASNSSYLSAAYNSIYDQISLTPAGGFNLFGWASLPTTSLYGSGWTPQYNDSFPYTGVTNVIVNPTRLITFNHISTASSACTNLINCQSGSNGQGIPVHVLFGTVSGTVGDGGAYATFNWLTGQVTTGNGGGSNFGPLDLTATVIFSNGTSTVVPHIETVSNGVPQSGTWQLPGDWSTSAGMLGYVAGNLVWGIGGSSQSTDGGSTTTVNYSANTVTFQVKSSGSGATSGPGYAGYGVYLKHTAAVNAQCVDANGSLDHKTETADYTFSVSFFGAGYGNADDNHAWVPGDRWYQLSTSIQGFWGSSTISIPGYNPASPHLSPVGDPDFSSTHTPYNGMYDNTYSPEEFWLYNRSPVNAGIADPCYPILDVIQAECNVLTSGTPYSGTVVPPQIVSNGPASFDTFFSDCLVAQGNDTSATAPSAEYGHDSPTNPDITNITYSCIDPRYVVLNPMMGLPVSQ